MHEVVHCTILAVNSTWNGTRSQFLVSKCFKASIYIIHRLHASVLKCFELLELLAFSSDRPASDITTSPMMFLEQEANCEVICNRKPAQTKLISPRRDEAVFVLRNMVWSNQSIVQLHLLGWFINRIRMNVFFSFWSKIWMRNKRRQLFQLEDNYNTSLHQWSNSTRKNPSVHLRKENNPLPQCSRLTPQKPSWISVKKQLKTTIFWGFEAFWSHHNCLEKIDHDRDQTGTHLMPRKDLPELLYIVVVYVGILCAYTHQKHMILIGYW